MTSDKCFCDRLRKAMKSKGMRTSDMARLCGVSRTTVRRWLVMGEADLAGKYLIAVSDALGVDIYWLSTGDECRIVSA
jgi:transcriptional regulator with XRE-family HTH domain